MNRNAISFPWLALSQPFGLENEHLLAPLRKPDIYLAYPHFSITQEAAVAGRHPDIQIYKK